MHFPFKLHRSFLAGSSSNFLSVQRRHYGKLINVAEKDGLRRITLADQKTRNSLSLEMMNELSEAIEENSCSPELRCIFIDAVGPVFSAGHNLKELAKENGIEKQKAVFSKCTELMLALRKSEVPVVSIVNGLAAAAGCQLVAASDFAIASDISRFSTPGASFGMFCSTPGIPVSRAMHQSTAAYMVLTGATISAQEALQSGLIVKVLPEQKIEQEIENVYGQIKAKSRAVLKLGKEFFYHQLGCTYEEALRLGEDVMFRNLQMKDGQEGIAGFKEKRKPVWTHKD